MAALGHVHIPNGLHRVEDWAPSPPPVQHIRDDITLALAMNASIANAMNASIVGKREVGWNMDSVKRLARDCSRSQYTAGILASGGCLDTISCILVGFAVLWGTEIDPHQRAMFTDITSSIALGDTYGVDWSAQVRVDYISSGQPCDDYSSSGSCQGEDGKMG